MLLLQRLNKDAEKWALLAFYVMLVMTMAVEVFRREIFAYSSIWGEEIVRYSFIYLAWIGAAAAVKDRAHIRIDVVMHYLSPSVKTLLYIFGPCLMEIWLCKPWSSGVDGLVPDGSANWVFSGNSAINAISPARSAQPSRRVTRLRRR